MGSDIHNRLSQRNGRKSMEIRILEDNFPSIKKGNITPLTPKKAKLLIKLVEEGRESIYIPQRRLL